MTISQIDAGERLRSWTSRIGLRCALRVVSVFAAFGLGLAIRWIFRGHATSDALDYTIPWYNFARANGIHALGQTFTNYTPFYSYLLVLAAQFDQLGQPLSLVKSISACFELACAVTVAEMVWHVTRSRWRGALAFVAIWLAPTVLFNGGAWGQADSIWAFFVLWSVSLFIRGRNGTTAFAVAFAVKAQAVFLGPFVLGLLIRRRLSPVWLFSIPIVYLGTAIPVLIAGRPITSVLQIYLAQAEAYHRLTMNAANVWALCSGLPYAIGVPVGLGLAGVAGLALAGFIGRGRCEEPTVLLLVASVSLFLMPYLLPKMHDRYFYPFELATIALACIDTRYLPVAAIAQVDGVLAYMGFDPGLPRGLIPAALCNGLLGVFLMLKLRNGAGVANCGRTAWLSFACAIMALGVFLLVGDARSYVPYVVLTCLVLLTAAWLLMEAHCPLRSRDIPRLVANA